MKSESMKQKRTIRNMALKGYIYRDPDAANPLPFRDRYNEYSDPEGTEVYFVYNPSRGEESDPNAYINNRGETLVDLANNTAFYSNGPTKKLKEFGTKNFRSKDSMIKQFGEATHRTIYSIPNGVVANDWQSESDDSWRAKRCQDESYPFPEHRWFSQAGQYSDWRSGRVYRGRIIDVPGEPDSDDVTIIDVDSERDIPKGTIFLDYPEIALGSYEHKEKAEKMAYDIRNAKGRADRRYSLDYAYGGYNLTERQIRNVGIEKIDDMKLGEMKYYENKDGIKFKVTRSASLKSERPRKRVAKKTAKKVSLKRGHEKHMGRR